MIYVPSYLTTWFAPPLQVVDDEIDITVKETTATPNTPLLTEDGVAVAPEPDVVAEEVDIQETIVLAEKVETLWSILVYGSANPRLPVSSIVTFLINVVFVLLTVDALYRARWYHPADDLSFVRVGYVSHNEASFMIREPDQSVMPVGIDLRVKTTDLGRPGEWWQTTGGVYWTESDADFTATVTVPLASPKQRRYQWRSSNNHSGEFLAAPKPGSMPQVEGKNFTFLSTSCILPRFPYSPLDHPLAIPGMRYLAQKLPELGAQFMLFLGDFIYVDVPERFGKSVDEYRMQYRQVYASPDWAPVSNMSWIHVLDDHEIANDWSAGSTGVYKSAMEPWRLYQGNANPPQARVAGSSYQRRESSTWFEFAAGPASFFMMDTRSYRSSNRVPFEEESKSMLGADQLADLIAWLGRAEPRGVHWKIIASSVPFTKNWPVNVRDTWGGFLVERQKILEAMWEAGSRGYGVVVVSGDRHEFAATKFLPPADSEYPESTAAYEFSTSPLNQFASPIPSYRQTDNQDVKLQ